MKYITIILISISILLTGCSSEAQQDKTSLGEETEIIYEFAKDINMKEYQDAYDKLGTILKEAYSGLDDKAFANIEHMDIKKLVDKTNENEGGKWYANPRNIGDVVEYKVFYAEIEYQTNDLITSYIDDGVNYQKVIIARETSDSDWKICEMSSIEKEI